MAWMTRSSSIFMTNQKKFLLIRSFWCNQVRQDDWILLSHNQPIHASGWARSCVTRVTGSWDDAGGRRALDEPSPGACLCARSCFGSSVCTSMRAVGRTLAYVLRSRTSGLVGAIWIRLEDGAPASSRCRCHPNTDSFPQTPAGSSAEH